VCSTANPPSQTILEQVLTVADVPYVLNDVINGTDFNHRIGRKIVVKSVDIRVGLRPVSTDAAKGAWVRMLLVWDRTPNKVAVAANSTLSDVLTDVLAGSGTTAGSLAGFTHTVHPNLSNRDRFVILRDKTVTIQPFELSTTPNCYGGNIAHFVHISKKLNAVTIFADTESSVTPLGTTIQTGRLLFFMVPNADSIVGATMSARVRYVDS